MLRTILCVICFTLGAPAMAKDGPIRADKREHVSEDDQAALEEFRRDLKAMNEGRMTFRQLIMKERQMLSGERSGVNDSPLFPEVIKKMPR